LELHNTKSKYYMSHVLPTIVKLIVWTLEQLTTLLGEKLYQQQKDMTLRLNFEY
jgi:hypothetical protein